MIKTAPKHSALRTLMMFIVVGAPLLLAFCAAPASAATSFEQVGCFAGSLPGPLDSCKPIAEGGEFGEEVQLGGVGGMAVNYTGAGGVPKGTAYAATFTGGNARVAMFTPTDEPGEEGLEFVEDWVVTETAGPYEVCGPEGTLPNGDTDPHPSCPPRVEASAKELDIEVDQTTGNVYVLSFVNSMLKAVVAYSADGGEEITRFGERAPVGESVATSPGKVHESPYPGGLAVNGDGEVYVFDVNNFGSLARRLMVFKPETPGDLTKYVYAGEILSGSGAGGIFPSGPVTDAAGNLYVGGGVGGETIEMFAPEAPAAFPAPAPAPPLCTFTYAKGGITAVTVNPLTGEVFFSSTKKETGFTRKVVHQLGPCNEETGEFEEISVFETGPPERGDLWGLAFDPTRVLAPGRPAGVLFAGAPDPEPSIGKGEPGQSSLGYIFAPPVEAPPVVEAESVEKVKTTSAVLRAKINPKGFKTHYFFQYLSEAQFQEEGESFAEAAEAPIGGADLEGTGLQDVAVSISGLGPDTAYRFRAVAESNCKPDEPDTICVTEGSGGAFQTYPPQPFGLPEDRAWELVSPAEKQGGQVLPADPRIKSCGEEKCKPGETFQHFPMQSSAEGNAVAYEGTPFGPGGALAENQYVSRRTASGWVTANPTPELLRGASQSGYRLLSSDLGKAVIGQPSPSLSPEAPPEYENLYAQSVTDPSALEPFIKQTPPNRPPNGAGSFETRYVGASADGSRVFFEANDALTGVTAVAPEAEDGGPDKFNLYEWFDGQLALVNVKPGNTEAPAGSVFGGGPTVIGHAISADGNTAFWSDESGQLYARINGTETQEIENPGEYLSASADGSAVLLQNGCLYSMATEECTDLTQGLGGFQGIVGQSDDLSHVYFIDTAALSGEEENSEGDKAQAGKFNLYAWVEGTTGFVATLAAGDNGGGSFNLAHDWVATPAARTAEASPNGRYVAFLSQAQLTGYENTGPCESDHAGGRVDASCPEAFVYDAVSGELSCASCNPSGTQPLGLSVLRLIMGPPYLPQPRYLTDTGHLYFDSQDSLVPADTNEGAEDVYEWEPNGVGECNREEGCVYLLSGGREDTDSNFLAADPSGANVFFTTRERLVAADSDELIDLYDVREGGGFAEEGALPPCQEACQPPPPEAIEPPPLSATLNDPGNAPPLKCKKGQVSRKGKCVKKNKKHKKHHKKKGSAKKKGAAK